MYQSNADYPTHDERDSLEFFGTTPSLLNHVYDINTEPQDIDILPLYDCSFEAEYGVKVIDCTVDRTVQGDDYDAVGRGYAIAYNILNSLKQPLS